MKKRIYLAALAALALASCTEKNVDQTVKGEMVELEVKVPILETKLIGTAPHESTITSLQVFVFDKASGELEAYKESINNLKLLCFAGEKEIVAIVNAPSLSDVTSLSDLQSRKSSFTDNTQLKLVMSGSVTKQLTAEDNQVTIDVTRLAARVNLTEVKNAMELEANRSKDFVINGAYLINVAGDKSYLTYSEPEIWYNKMRNEEDASYMISSSTKLLLKYDTTNPLNYYYYCYPNPTATDANDGTWSPRKTRLVLEAALDGEVCYYPVTLSEVEQNTVYNISMVITRRGSASPDIPVTTDEATVTVNVLPWQEGTVYDETI